jgi:hypothetical protein
VPVVLDDLFVKIHKGSDLLFMSVPQEPGEFLMIIKRLPEQFIGIISLERGNDIRGKEVLLLQNTNHMPGKGSLAVLGKIRIMAPVSQKGNILIPRGDEELVFGEFQVLLVLEKSPLCIEVQALE